MPCLLSRDNLAIRQLVPAHAFRFPCRSACLLAFSSPMPLSFHSVQSSVISAPLFVSPDGAVGRVVFACLLRSVRSVSSRACRRLVPFLACRHLPAVNPSACGRLLLLLLRYVPLSPLSRSSCRPAARFASLRHSPRFATRRAGSCLTAVVLGWLVARSRCLPCVGRGVVSAWRVIIMGCSRRGACYVCCVYETTAYRSCGIFVLSIGCIYRSIGFLIWPICPLLLLSASSYRLSITLS